jgi:hypothetical protein
MTAWHVHKWWFLRAALLLLLTGMMDAILGGFAAKPFPWDVLIPATLPMSMVCFAALPIIRKA